MRAASRTAVEQHHHVAEEQPSAEEAGASDADVREDEREPDCADGVEEHAGRDEGDRAQRALFSCRKVPQDGAGYERHHRERDEQQEKRRNAAEDVLAAEAERDRCDEPDDEAGDGHSFHRDPPADSDKNSECGSIRPLRRGIPASHGARRAS